PQDLDLDASLAHRHPGDAWLQVETARARGARVHDQPPAPLLNQWLVGVTVHDDVGSVSREQPFRCRTATDFVAMADVDDDPFELQVEAFRETRLARRVGVAVDGADGSDRRELVHDRRSADVTGVKDEFDAVEYGEDFGADEAVCIGDQPNEHAFSL